MGSTNCQSYKPRILVIIEINRREFCSGRITINERLNVFYLNIQLNNRICRNQMEIYSVEYHTYLITYTYIFNMYKCFQDETNKQLKQIK